MEGTAVQGGGVSATVMIVDDSLFMRKILRDIVEKMGLKVAAEAADGEEAVAKFKEVRPEVVTLDIVMPGKTGIEALREIMIFDPGAKVVMCSALGQEPLVAEAKRTGARDFVVKPFDAAVVSRVIRELAEGK